MRSSIRSARPVLESRALPALSDRAGRREFDLKDPLTISQSGCGASGESHHERAGRPCVRRRERRSLTPVNPLTGRVTAKGAPAYAAHSKSVELAASRQKAFVRADEVIRVCGCDRTRRRRYVRQESRRADLPKEGTDSHANSRKISPASLTVL